MHNTKKRVQNYHLDPFRLEEKRSFYAKRNFINKFQELYSKEYPSISNKNSGILWDKLNFSRSEELLNSPIYIDKISQIYKILKNEHGLLLDIGFGKGFIEKKLKKTNLNLYGIDISQKSIRSLKRLVKGVFKKGNITRIPFDSNYFDYVLCLDVLEHISPFDTFKALKEVNRVLKSNSALVISVPLNEGLEKMVRKKINPNSHVRVYTPEILKTELRISGFNIEREIYLSAFSKHYFYKKLMNHLFRLKEPNLLIIVAKKR